MADSNHQDVVDTGNIRKDAHGAKSNNARSMFAKMPVHIDAKYYNMQHPKRGMAILFKHNYILKQKLTSGSGTNIDCDNLEESLAYLGFDVKVYNDLPHIEITNVVEEAVQSDHSECDCLVMAVLSHGDQGYLYANDLPYNAEYLWTSFTADRCPTLAGKPKVFFIEASQGDQLDGGITLTRTEVDGTSVAYKIPTHADFLVAYSTVPGYFSWRNTTSGSWFIQALCFELKYRGREIDILTLLTFVSQRVAIDFESNCPENPSMHDQKQIPCISSMLSRLLRFTQKNDGTMLAKMPSHIDATYYNMQHPKRGIAIIFNHENFGIQDLHSRSGTNVDRDNLEESLVYLGFDVKVYNDLPYKEITKVVEEAVQSDHSECDCLVMAVLSNGGQGILYANDVPYKAEYLWTSFTADRCPTLAGKPKVFFIQRAILATRPSII